MKIKIKHEIEKEVEVELPYYCKYGYSLHRIDSEKKYVEVTTEELYREGIYIQDCLPSFVSALITQGTKITPDIFNNAFQNALSKLCALDANDIPKATDEEIMEAVEGDDVREPSFELSDYEV